VLFRDRVDAGRRLAERLTHLRGQGTVVLGLPRGGVPVAAEVADALGAPLDVVLVRKLGLPSRPELAMGAIGEGGVRVLDERLVGAAHVGAAALAAVERREAAELERRALTFRGGRPALDLAGRTAVVVDDGVATGSTARAACQVVRALGAARVVLAVPVAPRGWVAEMGGSADEYVALSTPEPFWAIGRFYGDFRQTTDAQVVACLGRSGAGGAPTGGPGSVAPASPGPTPAGCDDDVVVAGAVALAGHLSVPSGAGGLVVFAHGSGSSRLSPRNRYVAEVLGEGGLGTLLLDLLTADEEGDRAKVFDIELLAGRLADAARWVTGRPESAGLPLGLFGASTGAAAALWASTAAGLDVRAVVSRGGRPDLAWPRLDAVTAPTLLVVGGRDTAVLELNRQARARLRCTSELVVVPGATHLFEEPGTLRQVALAARDWFVQYLGPPTERGQPGG